MSNVTIRPADLEADRELLVHSLLEHLTARSTERRYRWFYLENPHGAAQAWIANEVGSRRIVGSGSIVPRRMLVNGVPRVAAVMADFWVHPDFRSLGVAVKLQRACVEGASDLGFAFYDLPQGKMPAVYQRLRMLGDERLRGFAKPLCSEEYIRKVVPSDQVARALAVVGDGFLRFMDVRRRVGRCVVERHEGEIGSEFAELAVDVSARYGICVERTPEYLSWRYRRHYHLSHEIYTARRDGKLIGYAVVVESEQYADVVDLFGRDEPGMLAHLLLWVAAIFRKRRRSMLTLAWHAPRTCDLVLRRAGFRERSARPFVIKPLSQGHGRPADWFLTYGDIDY